MALGPAADTSRLQWDQIVSILKTEAASGRLKDCAWTDVKGNAKTTTLADVQRSLDLYTENLPAAGVQLTDMRFQPEGAGRRLMITEFTILISAKASDYADGSGNTVIANGADALAQGYAFIADGNGNGLSPIFTDQNNYTLNGNARVCRITGNKAFLQIDRAEGGNSQVWADYYVTLHCEQLVNLF